MGVAGGPDLIQDGLVLALDASDRNSYVSGSTTWFDLSGLNNSGSLINGPTFNTGSLGSIVFDGSNDYISCGNSDTTLFPGDFTVNFWANPTAESLPYGGCVISKRNAGFFQSNYQVFFSSGTWVLQINGSSPNYNVVSGSAASFNTWYYVTCRRNSNTMEIYYNSILQSSAPTPTGSSAVSNTVLRIGTNHDLNGPFNGRLASTQIYNRALTPSEILQNYNATKTRFGL